MFITSFSARERAPAPLAPPRRAVQRARARRAAPLVVARDVEDPDLLSSAIADNIRGEYVQLEASAFRARWTVVCLESLVLQYSHEMVAVARHLEVPQHRWLFIVALDVPVGARWDGRPMRKGEIVAYPPGTSTNAVDPRGTRFALITADRHSSIGAAASQLAAEAPSGPYVVDTPGTAESPLADRLRRLRKVVETRVRRLPSTDPSAIGRAAAGISEELIETLRDRRIAPQPARSVALHNEIVRRTEHFFMSHVGETVSIAQLSAAAGVSERSFRNAFYDIYMTSPKRYLKVWQLHHVRRALRAGASRGMTVTDAATFHGFFELGRFAGEYKALFGEPPSKTLHRARAPLGASMACAAREVS
jgi:AraC family ethanolamine operon transcriptional activator